MNKEQRDIRFPYHHFTKDTPLEVIKENIYEILHFHKYNPDTFYEKLFS